MVIPVGAPALPLGSDKGSGVKRIESQDDACLVSEHNRPSSFPEHCFFSFWIALKSVLVIITLSESRLALPYKVKGELTKAKILLQSLAF